MDDPLTEADPLAFNWQEDDQAANWRERNYAPPLTVKSVHVGAIAVREAEEARDTGDVPVDPKPDSPRYASLGDAVTTNCAEWIGIRLMRAVEKANAENA
jgi:site-specific DNA-cytosine methylase